MVQEIARLASLVLAMAFAWAAVAKVFGYRTWRHALTGYRLGGVKERLAAIGVPAAELCLAVLLFAGWLKIGAAASVAVIAAFSLAVLRARAIQGDRLPCGCFGRASERDYRELLYRNAMLGVLAAGVLVAAPDERVGLVLPDAVEILPALLATVGVGLVAWMLRQLSHSLREKGES
jgi:hypothetical protein